MMRMRGFSVFVLTTTSAIAYAQPAPLAYDLDQAITSALATSGAPSVSVAVVRDKSIAYAKAFGKADIASDRPANAQTRYAVGSISKQFTASAILLMQEQGKLSLDDKVAKYFPDLTRANEITIRELLSHTSGYEDYAPQDYIIPEWTRPTTPRAIIDHWAKKPLNFDPGTKWQYSNTGYVLAALIFEKVAGQPLVAFLREKIFDRLHMSSAGDCSVRSPSDATPYTRFALGPPRVVDREGPGWYLGAGELCMTPSDLARWDIAFLQKKILSPASYEEFTREVRLADGDHTHYALGLQITDIHGAPAITHSGEVSGFLASNTVLPNRDAAVILLSNEDGINLIFPLADQIARTVAFPAQPSTASEQEIEQVRGILAALRDGKVDRGLFTANANAYFTDIALGDIREIGRASCRE